MLLELDLLVEASNGAPLLTEKSLLRDLEGIIEEESFSLSPEIEEIGFGGGGSLCNNKI